MLQYPQTSFLDRPPLYSTPTGFLQTIRSIGARCCSGDVLQCESDLNTCTLVDHANEVSSRWSVAGYRTLGADAQLVRVLTILACNVSTDLTHTLNRSINGWLPYPPISSRLTTLPVC